MVAEGASLDHAVAGAHAGMSVNLGGGSVRQTARESEEPEKPERAGPIRCRARAPLVDAHASSSQWACPTGGSANTRSDYVQEVAQDTLEERSWSNGFLPEL